MRAVLRLALLIAVLGLPGLAAADQRQMSPKPSEPAASAPAESPWYREAPPGEACWGDSTENDDDLNDGARITTEEILRILNPAQS